MNGYAYVGGNPVTSRDLLGFRALGQYDSRTDSMRIGRFGISSSTVWSEARFTAPGLANLFPNAQPNMSSYAPSKSYNGYSAKPKAVTPKAVSTPTAHHQQDWWNPFTWSGETWQNVGAVAAGVAATIAITAALVGTAACAAATAGVCLIGVGMIAGAAGGLVAYNLSSGEKSPQGAAVAVAEGAVFGGAGAGVGAVVGRVASKIIAGAAQRAQGATAAEVVPATPNRIAGSGSTGTLEPSRRIDWARVSGILRDARTGKGNFGLGSASLEEAESAGRAWVGEGYTISSNGKAWVSADGLRQWRPPTWKPSRGGSQSNFESRWTPQKEWQANGHLDIEG